MKFSIKSMGPQAESTFRRVLAVPRSTVFYSVVMPGIIPVTSK